MIVYAIVFFPVNVSKTVPTTNKEDRSEESTTLEKEISKFGRPLNIFLGKNKEFEVWLEGLVVV